jgi:V8-like Glu-specific endopeptidase
VRSWRLLSVLIILYSGFLNSDSLANTTRHAGSAPAGEATGPVSRGSARTGSSNAAFWTKQRMLGAKPMDTRGPHARESVASESDGEVVDRRPTIIDPFPASRSVRAATRSEIAAPKTASPYAYLWPGPYDQPPATTSGKVFFKMGGSSWVCSGTAVNSPNKSLVWTAGHCVYSQRKGWATHWMFCPGYHDGRCLFGKWTYRRLGTTSVWFSHRNFAYDFGAARMMPLNGARLANSVGAQGILFNLSADQYWWAFGYPAEDPFHGQNAWVCENSTAGRIPYNGPDGIWFPCDMTGGSSGGGWHINFNGTPYGYVNGVNSSGPSDEMWGPYQGDAAKDLYNLMG